jgi:glutamyl-tRNA synthetase
MSVDRYRGRLAPSPTGRLHLGHARTYLVAWLRARDARGDVVLRIEDLDPPRVVEGSERSIERDLEWLGLDWDEGPGRGGPHAPYRQSERGDRYERALATLRAGGHVFACTCTRKEIARVASAPHGPDDLGPRYPGTCRDGPAHPDRAAAIRFRMPDRAPPFVEVGPKRNDEPEPLGGDFVVRRADGVWAYQLAVVVDDAEMGITEVVRGDDLLGSTPLQVALYDALGLAPPQYLHLPLVVDETGQRLSKRHGGASIEALRLAGVTASEAVGWIAASVGIGTGAPCTPRDLIGRLDLSALPPGPAVAVPGGVSPLRRATLTPS